MYRPTKLLSVAPLLIALLATPLLWSDEGDEANAMSGPQVLEGPAAESPDDKQQTTPDEDQPAGDFKPSEEISEDFPVLLPSDI